MLANLEHHTKPGTDAITQLFTALTPLFDDVTVPGMEPEQVAGMFPGILKANTVLCAKAGVEPVDTERLVHLVLHGLGAENRD